MLFIPRKWIVLATVLTLLLAQLAWILVTRQSRPGSSVSIGQQPSTGLVTTTTTSPSDDSPPLIKLGVLVTSQTPGSIDDGLSRAFTSIKAKLTGTPRKIEIVRCVVVRAQTPGGCAPKFRAAQVKAVIANPDIDPTDLLEGLKDTDIPYVGVYPQEIGEFTAPNSFQFGAGARAITIAPLRWAEQTKASKVIYVSTAQTKSERDLFLAQATKAKIEVKAFTFLEVGTDLVKYLAPVNGRKPLIVFSAESNGCPVIVRGLNRRKAVLSGLMEATFLPASCSKEARATDLDGLRVVTASPFSINAFASAGSLAEIAGQSTLNAIDAALPDSAWQTGPSFREALTTARSTSSRNALGTWSCEQRPDPALPALCGQQVFLEGLSTDTAALRVWVDALTPGVAPR